MNSLEGIAIIQFITYFAISGLCAKLLTANVWQASGGTWLVGLSNRGR